MKIKIIVFLCSCFILVIQSCKKSSEPTVTTTTVSGITTTSAVTGGNVTNNGGDEVTVRGTCWSTSPNPSVSSTKTNDGTGNGPFTSNITGLTVNTNYHVRAYATNTEGTAYGNDLTFTTASTVPGAPTIGTATAGNAQATVIFTEPADNGGSAITGYTATSNSGNLTGTGSASPVTVTGLTNGVAYTFTVTATNANGTGPASSASNQVTPLAPLTVPGAPTIGTATKGNSLATVTFTAPSNNGGSTITSYTATSNPGGITASGTASPIIVTGLTNGTAYTFTVTATNTTGTSTASAASNSVTPSTVPGAPTAISATAGCFKAVVTFSIPGSNGGSAITGYTITSSPGGFTATGPASPITVTHLLNGIAYTFTAVATNANGNSAPSIPSNSVIPEAPSSAVDRDNNLYHTVSIGYQVWLKENLKTTKYTDGGSIPNVTDDNAWKSATSGAYCWYNNDAATYRDPYGAMYNWYAVSTGKLCPSGWHVPSSAEWDEMVLALDPDAQLTNIEQSTIAGGKLKETGTVHWLTPNPATNETGFTAVPGGYRVNVGTGVGFMWINSWGEWYTSTEYSNGTVGERNIRYINSSVYKDNQNISVKWYGMSVRCVMD
jgi:uncharacterized protein (TIGR02145 family)